jgi:hypothetical protein
MFLVSLLPSRIEITRDVSGLLVLEWGTDDVLQEADSVTGDWVDLPSARTPNILTPVAPGKFYRLKPR